MAMECPFFDGLQKSADDGTHQPGNGGFPCGIDDLRQFVTGTGLPSLILEFWNCMPIDLKKARILAVSLY